MSLPYSFLLFRINTWTQRKYIEVSPKRIRNHNESYSMLLQHGYLFYHLLHPFVFVAGSPKIRIHGASDSMLLLIGVGENRRGEE
jgi:hypothetical protein